MRRRARSPPAREPLSQPTGGAGAEERIGRQLRAESVGSLRHVERKRLLGNNPKPLRHEDLHAPAQLSINTCLADGSRRHMGASVDGQCLHLFVDESLNEPTHILVPGDQGAERRHVEHKHLGARTVTCCRAMLQQRRNPHTWHAAAAVVPA